MYPEYEHEIQGLCPNKCSCDICRKARINDKGYQQYLSAKWKHELAIRNKRTMENAIECDRIGQLGHKGHASAVSFFQNNA